MKKIWLIAFLFCGGFLAFGGESLFKKYTLFEGLFSLNCASETKEVLWGAKLCLPFAEGRFYSKGEQWNFGIGLSSLNLFGKFRLSFKSGNLSFGGAASKLNNPLVSSSVNPFASGGGSVYGLTLSLPSDSTFNNPLSFLAQLEYEDSASFFKNGSVSVAFVSGEKDFDSKVICSSLCKIVPFKGTVISALFGAGVFPISYSAESSWYFQRPYFTSFNSFCGLSAFSIKNAFYTGNLYFNFYEGPFESFTFCLKNENSFKLGHFVFNVSEVFNPFTNIVTPSQKNIEGELQLKVNLYYNFWFMNYGNVFCIKPALAVYACKNFIKNEELYKASGGVQFLQNKFLLALYANTAYEKSKITAESVVLKANLNFLSFSPVIAETVSVSGNLFSLYSGMSEKTYISVKFYDKKYYSIYASGNVIFYQNVQNGAKLSKITAESGVSAKISFPYINISAKLSIKYAKNYR